MRQRAFCHNIYTCKSHKCQAAGMPAPGRGFSPGTEHCVLCTAYAGTAAAPPDCPASRPLADYASELDDFVVLTSDNKPVAAIVSLKNLDPESLALSTNAELMEIVAQARRKCAQGKTVSLQAMKSELGL